MANGEITFKEHVDEAARHAELIQRHYGLPDFQLDAVKNATSMSRLILALRGVNKFLEDKSVTGPHKNSLTVMIQVYESLR